MILYDVSESEITVDGLGSVFPIPIFSWKSCTGILPTRSWEILMPQQLYDKINKPIHYTLV